MDLIHKNVTQNKEVPKPRGLRQRGKSYEIRVRVPERIRAQIGKREIVKSFGSVSYREACVKGHLENAAIEQRFQLAEAEIENPSLEPLDDRELADLAFQFLSELELNQDAIPFEEGAQSELKDALDEEASQFGSPNAAEDPALQEMANTFAQSRGVSQKVDQDRYKFYEAIQAAMLEHLQRRSEKLAGRSVATINPAFGAVRETYDGPNISLSDAIEAFLDAPVRRNNSEKTKKSNAAKLLVFQELVGGDRPVREISKSDIRGYVNMLTQMPSNAKQRFPNMSAKQSIREAAKTNAKMLGDKSIKLYIDAAKSLFRWLQQEELVDSNPAASAQGPAISSDGERRPLDDDELTKFMNATSEEERGSKDWLYWVSRICLFQGFRFKEPLGLLAGDLKELDGIWVFVLKQNDFRSLKTAETARTVPVHPELLRLGIVNLKANKKDTELLFSDAPRSANGSFDAAGKRMMRLIRSHVSIDQNVVFHSLRHNFRDALREAEAPQEVAAKLGGWRVEGSDAMRSYGAGVSLKLLSRWIKKLRYPMLFCRD